MNLHDCLSLGEIQAAASEQETEQDMERLPTFLRLLELSRQSDLTKDVELLEDKAALYSISEDVEAVNKLAKLAAKGKLDASDIDSLQHKVQSVYKDVQSLLKKGKLSPDSWIVSGDPLIGPILVALMHYTDIRYRDMVEALYSVQAGHLVTHLAANCPLIVPSILDATGYDLQTLSRREAGRISLKHSSHVVVFDPLSTAFNILQNQQEGATVDFCLSQLSQTSKPTELDIFLRAYCVLLWRGMAINEHCLPTLQGLKRQNRLWGVSILCTVIASGDPSDKMELLERLDLDRRAFHDPETLQVTIHDSLKVSESPSDAFARRMAKFCRKEEICELPIEDPSLLVSLLPYADSSVVRRALQVILSDRERADQYWTHPSVVEILETATKRLDKPAIPVILPVRMEQACSNMPVAQWTKQNPSMLLLMLLHCFLFLEIYPTSPFCFNPRVLDLKRIVYWCKSRNLSVCKRLKELISQHAPEINMSDKFSNVTGQLHQAQLDSTWQSINDVKIGLRLVLKRGVEFPDFDPCGRATESCFVRAANWLSDADLVSITSSALMSRPSSPALFLTYPMLYKDPLTPLKFPIATVWKRRGARRLAIFVLSHLLLVNESLVLQACVSEKIKKEYLFSRDLSVIRSLLCLVLDPAAASLHCEMTVGMIRKTVAKRRGVVAMLMKQSMQATELDWMIENVPEMIYDVPAFRILLEDSSSLTVAERLEISDGALRVVIAQGHAHSDEVVPLVVAAMSHLLCSFHLINGPVGVPVSAVLEEGADVDATQVARRAAFRMLKALTKIKIYRTRLRKECLLSLTKLHGLCKGEGLINLHSSVPRTSSGRQNRFLKEFSDAVLKALDALGAGQGPG